MEELLLERVRVGLGLVLCASLLFALSDLEFGGPQIAALWSIKLVVIVGVALAFRYAREGSTRRYLERLGLALVAVAASATALSGVLVGDAVTTPIVGTAIALATATLLPWGLRRQTEATGLVAVAILVNAFGIHAGIPPAAGYPTVAVAIGLALSIFAAREMESHRGRLARERIARAEAREALTASEARLDDVASQVPGVVYQFLLQPDGSYSFPLVVDSPYLKQFGVSAEELLKDPTAAFRMILPEDRENMWSAIAEMPASDTPGAVEFRSLTTSGATKWFRGTSSMRTLADGSILSTGLIIDISDRKEAEATARRLAAIVESSEDAIIGMDLDGKVRSWNAGAERLYGYTAVEMKGRSISVLLPEERHGEIGGILQRIRERERVDHFETTRVRKDGRAIPVSLTVSPIRDESGKVTGASTIARDISERIKMETELRRAGAELEARVNERTGELSEINALLRREIAERQRAEVQLIAAREEAVQSSAQYRAVLNTVGEGIINVDQTSAILMVNRQVEKIWGYAREELIGQPLDMLIPEQYRSAQEQGIERYVNDGGEGVLGRRFVLEGLRKDGSTFPLELGVEETRVGQQLLFTAAVRDISERRRVEADLKAAKEVAEQANRAKSEFLANVSHEIRTPMNAVIGMTGLLLDTDLTRDQREFAETVRAASSTMLSLTNDLLDSAKMEAGRLELETQPFDLSFCIEEALDLVAQSAAEKGLELAYAVDPLVPYMLVGDMARLRQVLVNLLSNGVRFTHVGEVTLRVNRVARSDGTDTPRTVGRGGIGEGPDIANTTVELHFTVRDTGIGIPSDRFDRLFRPFGQVDSSTTRRYGGTGLGLSLCRHLTGLMGGRIWLESTLGVGSTFHFTVVLGIAEQMAGARDEEKPAFADRRVVLVEPHPVLRETLERRLKSWGLEVYATEEPRLAAEWLDKCGPFDLAIVDLPLTSRGSTALLSAIEMTDNENGLPAVGVVPLGKRQEDYFDGNQLARKGFSAYVTKPVTASELYEVLAEVLGGPRDATSLKRPGEAVRLAERLPLRILVAEDNMVNQSLAVRLLARMGYRADVAANGVEVIQALRRQPYDVVLMDVQMPEMDGFQAARRIAELWPEAERPRIIAVTAHVTEDVRKEYRESGMRDFVGKPYRAEDLELALKRCCDASDPLVDGHGTAAPAAVSEGLIDRSALARLDQGQEDDEPDLVAELIGIFLQQTPPGIEAIRAAIACNDAEALDHAAHRLKSGSGQLGARTMSTLCAELEKRGKTNSVEGSQELLERLEIEFSQVRTVLEQERQARTTD